MTKNTAASDETAAAPASSEVTLLSPDGRAYSTADPVEIVNLRAEGYTEKTSKKS